MTIVLGETYPESLEVVVRSCTTERPPAGTAAPGVTLFTSAMSTCG
jgi:hypothetical protein